MCSTLEKLDAERMLDLHLAGIVPEGKVLGSDEGLELQAKLSIVSGKARVAETSSWPNCAQNRLGVGGGSLFSPYTFLLSVFSPPLSIPLLLDFLLQPMQDHINAYINSPTLCKRFRATAPQLSFLVLRGS